jgi:hypothetical protein
LGKFVILTYLASIEKYQQALVEEFRDLGIRGLRN